MPTLTPATDEFWLGTPTVVHPYVVTVSRPGRVAVCFGYDYAHQAETAAFRFRESLTHTAHIEGTTIMWEANDTGVYAYSPVPTDEVTLSGLIHSEPDTDPAERFPDLFTRLDAQIGEDAGSVWSSACRLADQEDEAVEALGKLGDALTEAATALDHTRGPLRTLEYTHPDYDGTLGEDIAAHLADAARSLRAADALHRQVVSD